MLTPGSDHYRYFIELAFDGTGFCGWQVQTGVLSVQEYLSNSLSTLLKENVSLTGCGRTDSGVHASHFIAHFDVSKPVKDPAQVVKRLKRYLKGNVRIDRIEPVKADLHARFHAISRTYHYLIDLKGSPFHSNFAWKLTLDLDISLMNQAAGFLIGQHDFTSFSKLHSDAKTPICTVYEAFWEEVDGFIVFRIKADRFLRNMVRAIVGTLIEIGKGKIPPEGIKDIMAALNRSSAGTSVPASGLFLTRVDYDPSDFKVNPVSPFPELIRIS
jgi:tRNA pseudouridine38-40 synthase